MPAVGDMRPERVQELPEGWEKENQRSVRGTRKSWNAEIVEHGNRVRAVARNTGGIVGRSERHILVIYLPQAPGKKLGYCGPVS